MSSPTTCPQLYWHLKYPPSGVEAGPVQTIGMYRESVIWSPHSWDVAEDCSANRAWLCDCWCLFRPYSTNITPCLVLKWRVCSLRKVPWNWPDLHWSILSYIGICWWKKKPEPEESLMKTLLDNNLSDEQRITKGEAGSILSLPGIIISESQKSQNAKSSYSQCIDAKFNR